MIAATPHPALGTLAAALADFRAAYPDFDTAAVADLRAREYARLDAGKHVYLDYTGGGLYAASQVRLHQELLLTGVFGNPTRPTQPREPPPHSPRGRAPRSWPSSTPTRPSTP